MAHFVGLDVSVQETAVCVVDEVGNGRRMQKSRSSRSCTGIGMRGSTCVIFTSWRGAITACTGAIAGRVWRCCEPVW